MALPNKKTTILSNVRSELYAPHRKAVKEKEKIRKAVLLVLESHSKKDLAAIGRAFSFSRLTLFPFDVFSLIQYDRNLSLIFSVTIESP